MPYYACIHTSANFMRSLPLFWFLGPGALRVYMLQFSISFWGLPNPKKHRLPSADA